MSDIELGVHNALDWAELAEDGPHLDPIGASDMLYDFATMVRMCWNDPLTRRDPRLLWLDFQDTPLWRQYFPDGSKLVF